MGLGVPSKSSKDPVERAIDMKMSKSKPDTCIFMTDSEADVKRKIQKAYCPAKQVEENPIIDYLKQIVFESFKTFKIDRPAKFGGPLEYRHFNSLADDYSKGQLHPMDLKQSTADHINKLLEPVRAHFKKNKKAKELKAKVEGFKITR